MGIFTAIATSDISAVDRMTEKECIEQLESLGYHIVPVAHVFIPTGRGHGHELVPVGEALKRIRIRQVIIGDPFADKPAKEIPQQVEGYCNCPVPDPITYSMATHTPYQRCAICRQIIK